MGVSAWRMRGRRKRSGTGRVISGSAIAMRSLPGDGCEISRVEIWTDQREVLSVGGGEAKNAERKFGGQFRWTGSDGALLWKLRRVFSRGGP